MTRFPVAMFAAALALPIASAGCSRDKGKEETRVPTAEVQSQSPVQQGSQPIALTGCLRAGDAADTYVLTTSQTKDGEQSATYTLSASSGLNLRDHMGTRVNVTGTVIAQQSATSQALPQRQESPTGTSGAPTVRTQTDLRMRQLNIASINPTGERCDK